MAMSDEARSNTIRRAQALNRAARALWEHDMERDGGSGLSWRQVAQDGWEQEAQKILLAYENDFTTEIGP